MTSKFWLGKPPIACQLCGDDIATKFYDAKTARGSWASMDEKCFQREGVGLGLGKGQRYELNGDGHWEKTGG
jgi:hypothetical protein